MPVLVRALTYASLFIALVLVFIPARLLSWSGIMRPESFGFPQIAGIVAGLAGAALALWCVLAFPLRGGGTPAPFDPPRRLVILGPYRFVRNPMYMGAGLALAGASLYYESIQLMAYTGLLWLIEHLFVLFYEEPQLRQNFGEEYAAYCRIVGRWLPRL